MGSIIVVTAPSGCGKSTLINAYMKSDKNASFAISHTTREKRGGEQDDVEYHFIDVPTFKQMIASGEFVEWALVHDNYYGTSKTELENVAGDKTIILDIDVQGAVALQKMNIDALFIFVEPPSIEELKNRLKDRNTDKDDVIEKRVWNAKRELEYTHLFDTVIVNSELDKAQAEFNESIASYKDEMAQKAKEAELQNVQAGGESVIAESVVEREVDSDVGEVLEGVDTESDDNVGEVEVSDSVEATSVDTLDDEADSDDVGRESIDSEGVAVQDESENSSDEDNKQNLEG